MWELEQSKAYLSSEIRNQKKIEINKLDSLVHNHMLEIMTDEDKKYMTDRVFYPYKEELKQELVKEFLSKYNFQNVKIEMKSGILFITDENIQTLILLEDVMDIEESIIHAKNENLTLRNDSVLRIMLNTGSLMMLYIKKDMNPNKLK